MLRRNAATYASRERATEEGIQRLRDVHHKGTIMDIMAYYSAILC